jgi:phosphotransferase system HPr (HPr) family protein
VGAAETIVRSTLRVPEGLGLHARPCTAIARLVQASQSRVTLSWDGRSADAGNIIELLTLGVPGGSELAVEVRGPDAATTIQTLTSLLTSVGKYDA